MLCCEDKNGKMFKEQRKKGGDIRKWNKKKKKEQDLTCSHPPNSSCNPATRMVTAESQNRLGWCKAQAERAAWRWL